MKLYVEKKVSTKTNKEYTGLYLSLSPTRSLCLTLDNGVLLEVADLKPSELSALQVGKPLVVGDVIKK